MRRFVTPLLRDIKALKAPPRDSDMESFDYSDASTSQVFVVHGYRGSLNDYSALTCALKREGVKVHGVSYGAQRPLSSGQESLEAALGQVPAGSKVCLVGHSLGGVIAARAALNSPDRVSGVVTVSAPLRGTWWARIPMSGLPELDALRPGSAYLAPLALLGSPSQPLLSLSGTGDAVTRPQRSLCAPGPGRASLLLPEGHHSILSSVSAHEAICDFVTGLLSHTSA